MTRERPAEPPKGFRRQIPKSVKSAVLARQEGRCARSGVVIATAPFKWPVDVVAVIDFDHRPPLMQRAWDEEAGDTIPPANDPASIEAVLTDLHRGVRSITSRDQMEAAKTRAAREAAIEHEQAMAVKQCGVRRPRRGTIKSRNTLRRDRDHEDNGYRRPGGGDEGAWEG